MSKGKLKVAIVGLGKMGLVHAGILSVIPEVQLVGLCEKSAITRRLLAKVFKGIPIVSNLHKLAELDIDAVYVTTPIPSHFPIVSTILDEGLSRNLFVEKTLATSYQQAKEICRLADTLGDTNMVGYLRRFYVTFRKAKDLLMQDVLGEIRHFNAYALSSDFSSSTADPLTQVSRGGVLRDLGCHAVDLALWFFGPLQVCGAKLKCLDDRVTNGLWFKVTNFQEWEGEFEVSWSAKSYRLPEVGFSIMGSNGEMKVDDDKLMLNLSGKKLIWHRQDLGDNVSFWLGLPEYYREDSQFVQSALNNSKTEPNFYDASKVEEIIDNVEKETGAI